MQEVRSDGALGTAVAGAFPGSRVYVDARDGFELRLEQHGRLRALGAAELSDGTLRHLLWTAALLMLRPPELMMLSKPETSLYPELLPALARLIVAPAMETQILAVSHAFVWIDALAASPTCLRLHLEKKLGETKLAGATMFNTPK